MPPGAAVELYWIPVGAGTPRLQQASLRAWEAVEAFRCRRPRATLYHSALKLAPGPDQHFVLEICPAMLGGPPPLTTGPVGIRAGASLRLFRYQLRSLPETSLPDEEWAVQPPAVLSTEPGLAHRILNLAPGAPTYTWGRRAPGTREMWTSDSTISWLLTRAGFDLTAVGPPRGGRAPGWFAGITVARRTKLDT